MIQTAPIKKISFHYLIGAFYFPGRTLLKERLVNVFKREQKPLDSLTYIFCDDDYLLEINKSYLNHNYFTDIITFNLAEKRQPVIGEIYISVDRVKENASMLNETFTRELKRVAFHGALHLCGYKDKKPTEIKLMREMEELYLAT